MAEYRHPSFEPGAPVLVYCASSTRCDPRYRESAAALGRLLARAGHPVVYGGGSMGSMGALADAALAEGGRVVGIMPSFMRELEWGHAELSELHLVETMNARKRLMLEKSAAVVALPGATGTLEELTEAITAKRLGLFLGPVVLVNEGGFYDPLLALFERFVDERFMDERHAALWEVAADVSEVLAAIERAPVCSADAMRAAR